MSIKRRIRRKFGISAPRVAVRTHVAWYWRWLFITIIVALGILIADWLFDRLGAIAGWQRTGTLTRLVQLEKSTLLLENENAGLKMQLGVAQRESQIAAAAQAGLTQTVKNLQSENAKLQEDLAFMQSLATGGKAPGVSVERVELTPGLVAGEYHFTLWLLQSGQRAEPFKGHVQLLVTLLDAGRRQVVTYPLNPVDEAYRLNMRVYQRLEGVLKLSPSGKVSSVQVRVFQDGVVAPRVVKDAPINIS